VFGISPPGTNFLFWKDGRLGGLANQKDLTIRFFQFFDHYLKDAPAATWMTEGTAYLKKDNPAAPAK
jgi:hypothetical protein